MATDKQTEKAEKEENRNILDKTEVEDDSEINNSEESPSFGRNLERIGGLALIGGIVVSILDPVVLKLPIEDGTLGFVMIGGVIAIILGSLMKKFGKKSVKDK